MLDFDGYESDATGNCRTSFVRKKMAVEETDAGSADFR